MRVEVYGASDDLIEVDGDISEEFNALGSSTEDGADGGLLAFSDGTVLRIAFTQSGVWRIYPVAIPHNGQRAKLTITTAPENDEDNYSDRAVLEGVPLWWVVFGSAIAVHKGPQSEPD